MRAAVLLLLLAGCASRDETRLALALQQCTRGAVLDVFVSDEAGRPVRGTTITLSQSEGGPVRVLLTGRDGLTTPYCMPFERGTLHRDFILRTHREGFLTARRDISLRVATATRFVVPLRRGADPDPLKMLERSR